MKCDFTLTHWQQAFVEDNLPVIDNVIARYINVNEGVCGLGRDDLYQEGAVALCKAASTYDGTSAKFSTYATTVIRNHLYNHCRAINTGRRSLPSVFLDMDGPDDTDALIEELDAALLADCKRRYSGVTKLGVEALELQIKGLSGADAARLYEAKPNQVGAWISRAAQKMRKDLAKQGTESVAY